MIQEIVLVISPFQAAVLLLVQLSAIPVVMYQKKRGAWVGRFQELKRRGWCMPYRAGLGFLS